MKITIFEKIRAMLHAITSALDPLSKVAQILAVAIAGYWTWHLHDITGEADINPQVGVSAEAFENNKETRLLAVHVTEKNVGKVPIHLDGNALTVQIKKIPENVAAGYIDVDKQPVQFEKKDFLKRYEEETEIDAGTEFEEVEYFAVPPGLYRIEATVLLGENDSVNGFATVDVK